MSAEQHPQSKETLVERLEDALDPSRSHAKADP